MDQQANELLVAMYHNELQLGAGGKLYEIDRNTRVPPPQGRFMHDVHLRMKPELSIEIDLSYGFSTVFSWPPCKPAAPAITSPSILSKRATGTVSG